MKVVNESADDWDLHIDPVLFGYRVNVQASTKHAPFHILYGVKPRLPIDLDSGEDVEADDDHEARVQRVQQLAEHLVELRDTAKDNISAAQKKQKEVYDLKHAPPTYAVGDKVLKYNRRRDTRMGDKLQNRFTGPYVIAEILGRGVYRLQDGDVMLKQTVNATNLKRWVDANSPAKSPHTTPSKAPPFPSPPPAWVQQLNLNEDDRQVLASGQWLNDKLIDAVNKLVGAHVGGQPAETSLLAQSDHGFQAINTDMHMQIVFDLSHWIATACCKGCVYVANSLGSSISSVVVSQLKQLYASCVRPDGTLEVTVVDCAQQPNGNDCGVFAAAFMFEWATTSVCTNLTTKFRVPVMRGHLEECLLREQVIPFPKTAHTRSSKQCTAHTIVV